MVFLDAAGMITPGVLHLRQSAIIKTYPAIKDTCHHFQQKNNDKLGFAETSKCKEFYFGNQPGKQYEIYDKKQVFHTTGLSAQNRYYYRDCQHKVDKFYQVNNQHAVNLRLNI